LNHRQATRLCQTLNRKWGGFYCVEEVQQ
jgi:hypothetical protein